MIETFIVLAAAIGFGVWLHYGKEWRLERSARLRTLGLLNHLASSEPAHELPGDDEEFAVALSIELMTERFIDPKESPLSGLLAAARKLYKAEGFSYAAVREPPNNFSGVAGADYQNHLQSVARRVLEPGAYEVFFAKVVESFKTFLLFLPAIGDRSNEASLKFSVLLADQLSDLNLAVYALMRPAFSEDARRLGIFGALREQLVKNISVVSGARRTILPNTYKGDDVIGEFLGGTPLVPIFTQRLSLEIPAEVRFEHMHIVAGTGHGKTQTLQRLLVSDIRSDASLVVIDSQGQMLEKLAHLKHNKKLIYIDPADPDHVPSLNMFDVSRLQGLPQKKREQFLNGLIWLLEYVFAGLLKAELTSKQNVLFRYSLRLMLAYPDATLLDLVKFLSDPTPYLEYVKELPETAQEFFKNEFGAFKETRTEIRRRIYGVLENDSFRRMFASRHNQLDLAGALSSGALVLVDTAKSYLQPDASSLLGRYFIALTLQAALERQASTPAFLYIDEAGEYFDDNIDMLLNEARKRRLGLVMAHQYLDQLTPTLRSSIATNASIKMAGGVSDKDAHALSADMRTTTDFIAGQKKEDGQTNYALFIKNVTDHALSVKVRFGVLEAQPRLGDAAYAAARDSSRRDLAEQEEAPDRPAQEPPAKIAEPIVPFGAPSGDKPKKKM